jgi:hypothetical protein
LKRARVPDKFGEVRALVPALAAVAAAASLIAASPSLANAPASKSPARAWSTGIATWIHLEPKINHNKRLGYVRPGDSVKLRSGGPIAGPGCSKGFYPVEPYGYVCHDRTLSLELSGRYLEGMQLARGSNELLPFEYALSNGAPMYRRLPTRAEWTKEERGLGPAGKFKPQSWGNRGHEKLAEVRQIPASHRVPWFFADGGAIGQKKALGLVRRTIPHGSMLAYTQSFRHEGRTFVLSADGTAVPADRIRPFRESQFAGTELGKGVRLPIAFFRERARPKYQKADDGSVAATGASFAVRSFVEIDPFAQPIEHGKKRYLTAKSGELVAEDDATLITARQKLPFSVGANDKYVLFSITQGTLVAYQGLTPVYATLASPGAGGVPVPGRSNVKYSTTPMGIYRVTFKHRAATMSPEQGENRSFWIADVPYTQYFNAPFAIHTAYWHENFGEPMSAGCVNLSPRDGKWLFDWTDPKVPADWNGAAPEGPAGKGTFVIVTR